MKDQLILFMSQKKLTAALMLIAAGRIFIAIFDVSLPGFFKKVNDAKCPQTSGQDRGSQYAGYEYRQAEARQAIIEYIEIFYNRIKLHSSLEYMSPLEYKQSFKLVA